MLKGKTKKIYKLLSLAVISAMVLTIFVSVQAQKTDAYEAHVIGVTATIEGGPYCGDGNLDPGEQCDDGNQEDGDDCSAICEEEPDESCMKINEVYDDPDEEHGDADDEWIELYNACDHTVDLKDWYLKDNNSEEVIHDNYRIDPGQFVVIAANASTWSHWPLIPASAIKIALGGTSMFNHLNNDGDRVFLYDKNDNKIDAVSWGDDTSAFDPSVPNVPKGNSIAREPKGHDTDTAADWVDLESPNPGTNPHSSSEEKEDPPKEESPLIISTSDTSPSTENEDPPGDSGSDSTPGDSSGESEGEGENNENQEGSDSGEETGDETSGDQGTEEGNDEEIGEEGNEEENTEGGEGTEEGGEESSGNEEEDSEGGTTGEEGGEEETPPEPENNDPPPEE